MSGIRTLIICFAECENKVNNPPMPPPPQGNSMMMVNNRFIRPYSWGGGIGAPIDSREYMAARWLTLSETNIAPENRPYQKESSIPNPFSGGENVSFREGNETAMGPEVYRFIRPFRPIPGSQPTLCRLWLYSVTRSSQHSLKRTAKVPENRPS